MQRAQFLMLILTFVMPSLPGIAATSPAGTSSPAHSPAEVLSIFGDYRIQFAANDVFVPSCKCKTRGWVRRHPMSEADCKVTYDPTIPSGEYFQGIVAWSPRSGGTCWLCEKEDIQCPENVVQKNNDNSGMRKCKDTPEKVDRTPGFQYKIADFLGESRKCFITTPKAKAGLTYTRTKSTCSQCPRGYNSVTDRGLRRCARKCVSGTWSSQHGCCM